MTCIIGLEYKGCVYMGSDAAMSDEDTITTCSPTEKLFIVNNSNIILGVYGSIRLMQTLHYGFTFSTQQKVDESDEKYLIVDFIDELKSYLESKNVLLEDKLPDSEILIAFNKKLYRIDQEFQVFKTFNGYNAIGSGEYVAQGALEILKNDDQYSPEQKLIKALDTAVLHVQSVRGPYHILKMNKNSTITKI